MIHDITVWAKPKDSWENSKFRTAFEKERQDSLARWKKKQEFIGNAVEIRSQVIFIHGYLVGLPHNDRKDNNFVQRLATVKVRDVTDNLIVGRRDKLSAISATTSAATQGALKSTTAPN